VRPARLGTRPGQMGPGTRAGAGDPAGGALGEGFGWGDPAEGSGGRQGLPLARGGARRIRLERWEMPLWGEVGWNFPPQASAGLPRKNTLPQTFRRCRRKLLKMLRHAGRSERI
jgi:hypothetical protein